MNFQPFAYLLAMYVLGIVVAYFFPFSFAFFGVITAIIFTILLVFILGDTWKLSSKYFTFFILIFFFLIGFLVTKISQIKPENEFSKYLSNDKQIIEFKLIENAKTSNYYKKYTIEVVAVLQEKKWKQSQGKLLLKIPKEKAPEIDFGKNYIAIVAAKEVSKAQNPVPFQYEKYLALQHIYYEGKLDSIISIKQNTSHFALLKNAKNIINRRLQHSNYSEKSQEIIKAITFGDRNDMSFESSQSFSKAGVIHLLAISGLHIVLIFQFILFLFNGFSIHQPKKVILLLALLLLWIYAYIIGFQPSVLRSVVMISVYYGFYLLKRVPNIYHTLAFSALLLLLYEPLQLFDVGFQLSFIAVFFIVWLQNELSFLIKVKTKKQRILVNFLAVTLAAQLGTLPFSLYYFHQYSMLSLMANCILIPASSVLIGFSFICWFQVLIFPELQFFVAPYNTMIDVLYFITNWISTQNAFLFTKIPFSFLEMIVATSAIIYLKFLLKSFTWKRILLFSCLIFLFQITRFLTENYHNNHKELVVFNQFGNTAIAVKNNKTLQFLIKDSTQLSALDYYLLKPYALAQHQTKYAIKLLPKTCTQFTFQNKKIIILNENIEFISTKNVSCVIVSNSPKINWKNLAINTIQTIIFDGSNYPKSIEIHKKILAKLSYKGNIWITNQQGALVWKVK